MTADNLDFGVSRKVGNLTDEIIRVWECIVRSGMSQLTLLVWDGFVRSGI